MVAPRILMAKTSLDGHWRGINVVSRALRDAGFEVILAGMVTADTISRIAVDEDVDLVGLHIGGRVEVAERILDVMAANELDVPVMAGGTIPHYAIERLERRSVSCFPPGSSLEDIVSRAQELASTSSELEEH